MVLFSGIKPSFRWLQSSIMGKRTRFHLKIGMPFDHG
jgi:hypothetical protein